MTARQIENFEHQQIGKGKRLTSQNKMIKELLEQLVKFLKIVLVVVLIAAIADPHDTKNMLTGIVGSIEIIIGHPSLPKVHISK